jgi:hypothetical protein
MSIALKAWMWAEERRKIHAINESRSRPAMNLLLAGVKLNGTDPKLRTPFSGPGRGGYPLGKRYRHFLKGKRLDRF